MNARRGKQVARSEADNRDYCAISIFSRECCQSFMFHGAWSEAMRQPGNAVPVELAEVVATSVKRHLLEAQRRAGRA